jgi:threonine dehydrogenase-like Zn-dependent dehydrogenase
VRGLKVGQTVAVEPGIACGRCRACRQDRTNLCYRMRFLGGPDCTGAFQRYLTMPPACFKPLPGGVDPALASAAEPLGVALHALKLVGLRRGESVGILGGGRIGLSVLALARATGAKIVAVSDPRPARCRFDTADQERKTPGHEDREEGETTFLKGSSSAAVRVCEGPVGCSEKGREDEARLRLFLSLL